MYSHSCEYQFTVIDPGACNDDEGYDKGTTSKPSLIFNPSHPQSHNAVAHHSVMHYEKFGKYLQDTSISSFVVPRDNHKKFHLKFFDKLTYTDSKSGQITKIGYFNGIESFRRDAIRLSNGDYCAEIGTATSGILIMKCGHIRSLQVKEEHPCVYHATFYDDHPECSMLADNLW